MKKRYNNDIYDLFVNSTKIKRLYGKRNAISKAMDLSHDLFEGHRHVELVNIYSGEVIYST